ncbi:MAG TPA: response regulator [Bryobacteraceae bacterium]|nr:response regulator [Bryobacteraceae bacterium]
MSKTILIVEDEAIIADDLRHIVTRLGYTYLGRVATGIGAIEKACELEPDVILMDIRLRGKMTGIEAAEVILSRRPIAIVFLSAFSPDLTRMPGCAFTAKPFSPEQIRQGIDAALRERMCQSLPS